MPPKGKKGQEKGKSNEEERDEPLQAVVCATLRLPWDLADFVDSRRSLRDAFQSVHTRAPTGLCPLSKDQKLADCL